MSCCSRMRMRLSRCCSARLAGCGTWSRRSNYRVTIFGSARARPGVYPYDEVKRLAAELTTLGCDIITGGGPGLMQAANEGAMSVSADAPRHSIGVRVE